MGSNEVGVKTRSDGWEVGLIDLALRKYVEIMNYSDSLRHGRKYEICCHCDFEVGYRSFGELIVIMELEKLK